jgi:purine-binding chemotaxis protein CheW
MIELLVFELAGVRYGLRLACVREVVRAVLITPLPDAPAVVEGVINVRGELAPVYDLRLRFGHTPSPLRPEDQLVIAWTGSRLVALRCDRTEWIESVAADAIDPAPIEETTRRIDGIARLPDGVVLIHDLATFLDQAEAASLDHALETHSATGAT